MNKLYFFNQRVESTFVIWVKRICNYNKRRDGVILVRLASASGHRWPLNPSELNDIFTPNLTDFTNRAKIWPVKHGFKCTFNDEVGMGMAKWGTLVLLWKTKQKKKTFLVYFYLKHYLFYLLINLNVVLMFEDTVLV